MKIFATIFVSELQSAVHHDNLIVDLFSSISPFQKKIFSSNNKVSGSQVRYIVNDKKKLQKNVTT